jgi:excisionase family DNA binding protein
VFSAPVLTGDQNPMPIVILLVVALALATRSRRAGPRRWFTVREAAAYSKLGTRTIRKRIAEGILPAYTPRGSRLIRIDGDDLDDMMAGDGRIPSAHLARAAGDGDG